MDGKTPKYTAPALEKGLDILEHLSRSDAGLTQAEIGRALAFGVRNLSHAGGVAGPGLYRL